MNRQTVSSGYLLRAKENKCYDSWHSCRCSICNHHYLLLNDCCWLSRSTVSKRMLLASKIKHFICRVLLHLPVSSALHFILFYDDFFLSFLVFDVPFVLMALLSLSVRSDEQKKSFTKLNETTFRLHVASRVQ